MTCPTGTCDAVVCIECLGYVHNAYCKEPLRPIDCTPERHKALGAREHLGVPVCCEVETGPAVVYIAGPMTGLPEYNYPAFYRAAELLTTLGFIVHNPAEGPALRTYGEYLRRAIGKLIRCDAIYLLNGWQASRGATLELQIAHTLGMRVFYEHH